MELSGLSEVKGAEGEIGLVTVSIQSVRTHMEATRTMHLGVTTEPLKPMMIPPQPDHMATPKSHVPNVPIENLPPTITQPEADGHM